MRRPSGDADFVVCLGQKPEEAPMRAHAVDHHRSWLLLLVAVVIVAIALCWPRRAHGDAIDDDPARGPADDRGEVGEQSWSLATIGGALMRTVAISEQRPELGLVGGLVVALAPSLGHRELRPAPATVRRSTHRTARARVVVQPLRGHQQIVPSLALVTRF